MKNKQKHLLIIVISSALAACAASQSGPEEAPEELGSRGLDCISQVSIRDYYVLDDANLIVTGSLKRRYHVTLTHRAFGLRSTWRIGFRSPTGQICAGSSELIVSDGGSGDGTCRIAERAGAQVIEVTGGRAAQQNAGAAAAKGRYDPDGRLATRLGIFSPPEG